MIVSDGLKGLHYLGYRSRSIASSFLMKALFKASCICLKFLWRRRKAVWGLKVLLYPSFGSNTLVKAIFEKSHPCSWETISCRVAQKRQIFLCSPVGRSCTFGISQAIYRL